MPFARKTPQGRGGSGPGSGKQIKKRRERGGTMLGIATSKQHHTVRRSSPEQYFLGKAGLSYPRFTGQQEQPTLTGGTLLQAGNDPGQFRRARHQGQFRTGAEVSSSR